MPSRSCDGDVSNSFRCIAPVIAAISAALSPLCALVAGRAAVFPIPCGSAGGRRTCRMSCNLDLSAHRTPLPSSSSSSSRPRAVDHHAAVIIQSSVAWSSSSSSRRAVPPASVLSVERARPRRSSLATACITLSTAVLAVRLSTWLCVCVCSLHVGHDRIPKRRSFMDSFHQCGPCSQAVRGLCQRQSGEVQHTCSVARHSVEPNGVQHVG